MYSKDTMQELSNTVENQGKLISELMGRIVMLESKLITFTDKEINDLALKFQYDKSSEL